MVFGFIFFLFVVANAFVIKVIQLEILSQQVFFFLEIFQFQNWSWLVRFDIKKKLYFLLRTKSLKIRFFSVSFRHLRFTPDFWRYWTRKKISDRKKLATIYFFLLFLFYTFFSGYMWMLWVCVEEQAKAALRASAIPLSMVLCAHSSYDNDVVCLLRLIISFTDDYQWTIATISLYVPLEFSQFYMWNILTRVNFGEKR